MDLRDAFFDRLYELAIEDENFYFLTADMWAFSLGKYKENLGDRFINTGIAEQNMISVAAGLAKAGKKVCVYTITPFIIERCFEQIKVDLCCMNLSVMIVGIGAGLTYSYDGPTHHTPYDIAIMRTLPNMTIYSPSSPKINALVAELAYKNDGPSYIRLDKGDFEEIYFSDCQLATGSLGPEKEGDILFISTGTNVYDVRNVVRSFHHEGIESSWIDLFEIKPLNEKKIIGMIAKFKKIVVVEEHSLIGGLGSIVCELMAMHNVYRPLKRISLPDEFCKKYGDRNWIKKQYGLDMGSIRKTVLEWRRRA